MFPFTNIYFFISEAFLPVPLLHYGLSFPLPCRHPIRPYFLFSLVFWFWSIMFNHIYSSYQPLFFLYRFHDPSVINDFWWFRILLAGSKSRIKQASWKTQLDHIAAKTKIVAFIGSGPVSSKLSYNGRRFYQINILRYVWRGYSVNCLNSVKWTEQLWNAEKN